MLPPLSRSGIRSPVTAGRRGDLVLASLSTLIGIGSYLEHDRDDDLAAGEQARPCYRGYHASSALCDTSSSQGGTGRGDNKESKGHSFFDAALQAKKEWLSSIERLVDDNKGGEGVENEGADEPEETGQSSRPAQSAFERMRQRYFEFQRQDRPGPPASAHSSAGAAKQQGAENESTITDFVSFANKMLQAATGGRKDGPPDIEELVEKARGIANQTAGSPTFAQKNSLSQESSFLSQVVYFQENAAEIQRKIEVALGPHLADENFKDFVSAMPVAAMHYYLEHEDSIKTPSWKRRMHRFTPAIGLDLVAELNEALVLSELSYADTVEQVKDGLEVLSGTANEESDGKGDKPEWELLFCDTESRPNKPSHFLAMQKNASRYDDTLHVLMVVRGTKSIGDLITDVMMQPADYECVASDGRTVAGQAHDGIIESGRYLFLRHQKLLSTLLSLSKKRKLDITLIGHSLGAGAATIAAMEYNSGQLQDLGDVKVDARVVGFGCPALLSRELSRATEDFVTTVVADSDVIPRMSGATLGNLILDVSDFDYKEQAERDVEQALLHVKSSLTGSDGGKSIFRIDDADVSKIMSYVKRGLGNVATSTSQIETKGDDQRLEPILYPPGRCIHLYRDGIGISGSYVPCTFFNEIDVARTMFDDHLISSGYRRIFLAMMRDFHKDDHFSFSSKGFNY
mmetsp:Transcript_12606/g.29780  ORF Transcript_12606/g.29780 Transcript_12606/m.29780 type:complete len:686 (+) Transcript_12606:199-2256(+)